MPLPLLTWSQTAYTTTGYTAPTDAQVIQALNTASATLTKWRKISADTQTWNYIEFGGPIGSALENARVLVSVDPGASAVLTPDSSTAAIWIGYAPDGGTLGTWNSATPYGANRFTKYWRCCATAVTESVYFIESDEVLGVIFRDDSADTHYGALAGAIINPGAGDAEANGRVHGLTTGGGTALSATFLVSNNAFIGHGGSVNNAHTGVFRPWSPSTFDAALRLGTYSITNSTEPMQYNSGLETAVPLFFTSNQTPRYFIGSLRQMYGSKERVNRSLVPGVGFVLSRSTLTENDALLFSNL